MKFLRGLLLGICILFASHSLIAANHKHQKAEQATFVLYGQSKEEHVEHHGLCTAFAYKKAPDGYYLLTAGHCFQHDTPEDATFAVTSGQITDNPVLQPVEVLNYVDDGKVDVAELHLKTTKKYPILEFDKEPVNVEDKTFYVGYPEMVSQIVFTGRVASSFVQSDGPSDDPCGVCVGRIVVQTGGGPGASGAPVLSERTGKVIGIVEGHVFENGVMIVPVSVISDYYLKVGHAIKNRRSE